MKQFLVATSLAVLASIGLAYAPLWAKPADLPNDDKIKCRDGQEKGERGGIAIDLDALSGQFAVPGPVDAVSPVVLGAWLEQWLDALARQWSDSTIARAQQAGQTFEAAEQARRAGDFGAARTGYQQVHLLTPTSHLGQLAIDRIIEIEQRLRDAGEEAEPALPSPQSPPQSSLDGYRPLGLIEVTY